MLTVEPPRRQMDAAHRPSGRRPEWSWTRFLLAWCAAFHLITAITLAAAPWHQLLTAGTAPVFALASRYTWGVFFLAAGAASASLLRWLRPLIQVVTWISVMGLGGVWLSAFSVAVLQGQGSALGVVVWPFLYGPWAVAAVRLGLGKR